MIHKINYLVTYFELTIMRLDKAILVIIFTKLIRVLHRQHKQRSVHKMAAQNIHQEALVHANTICKYTLINTKYNLTMFRQIIIWNKWIKLSNYLLFYENMIKFGKNQFVPGFSAFSLYYHGTTLVAALRNECCSIVNSKSQKHLFNP